MNQLSCGVRRASLLIALSAVPAHALASPMTIDFAGSISLYETFENSQVGTDRLGTLSSSMAQGSMTFDFDLAPAATTEVFGDIHSYVRRSEGSPLDEFVSGYLAWENGTSIAGGPPAPAGFAIVVGDELRLENRGPGVFPNPGQDSFLILDRHGWSITSSGFVSQLGFVLYDDFLAEGAGFPTGDELPNFSSFLLGRAVFQSLAVVADNPGFDERYDGYQLLVDIESATLSATQVSEPGTLTAFLGGFTAIGLLELRKKVAKAKELDATA